LKSKDIIHSSGPTIFSSVIEKAIEYAEAEEFNDNI